MPTLIEVKDYLCIDFEDDSTDRLLNRLITTADLYMQGAIGVDYPKEDPRAKQIGLLLIADLYDNRGMSEKVSNSVRNLVSDFILQLQMELRRKYYD